jgi:SAM-dependent methyltransferase
MKREAPAAARNRDPILAVLRSWLPTEGRVLEIAAGTGEHAIYFAAAFPNLEWQPTDPDPQARASIDAWAADSDRPNLRPALDLDVLASDWPVASADAILAINLVHIAPPEASNGLLAGAARLLPSKGPLILYGPWRVRGEPLAPSNLAFDEALKQRDASFGLRYLEGFAAQARAAGFSFAERRQMPANNLMLRFERCGA